LNGRDNQMTPETRTRVLDTIKALGYHRNPAAHRLRSSGADTLGFLILDEATRFLADPMTDLFLAGFGDVLRENEYSLLIQASKPHWPLEQLIVPLLAGRVDGAVILLSGSAAERRGHVRAIAELEEPVVLVQEHAARTSTPAVVADDRRASRELCRHLIKRGHTRIAFLTASDRWSAIEERHAGYRAALRAAGLRAERELAVWGGGFRALDARSHAAELLDLDDPPTAIMCGNDLIALGAIMAAREKGMRVPDDVAITGFDDFEFAVAVDPALTTVAIPGYEMGRHAATHLISAPGTMAGATFRAELKIRASS
jgi:LacI family transcriptional regulator